jgi:quinoprotein glucose dehydrogenase
MAFFGVAVSASAFSADMKKIVLIAGPVGSHESGEHEYELDVTLLKRCLENSPNLVGVTVETHFNGWPADPSALDDADAIAFFSDGADFDEKSHPLLHDERMAIIEKHVKRGCGVLFFHYATIVPARYEKQWLDWVGGYFDYESGPERPGDEWKDRWHSDLQWLTTSPGFGSPDHPILRGVKPFEVRDEFYYKIRFPEGKSHWYPIWTIKVDEVPDTQTVAWALERTGTGRGFATTTGHVHSNLENEDFRKTYLNALVWTAGAEVPEAGVESAIPEDWVWRRMESETDDAFRAWGTVGGDPGITHYSTLEQINKENVSQLEPAWRFNSGDVETDTAYSFWAGSTIQSNPIIVDGVLYSTTPTVELVALDAKTGELIWRFNPWGWEGGAGRNRGVAFWTDGIEERLFYCVETDLLSIDAKTGELDKGFGNDGRKNLGEHLPEEWQEKGGLVCPSAVSIYKNLVIVPGRSDPIPGQIIAYDAITGERAWAFHLIPQPGEVGHDSWEDPLSYKKYGGCNSWSGIAVDTENEMVFVSTGEPVGMYRPFNRGQHLFGNSVVAIDANTGEYKWHYQGVHHDLWDLDMSAPPMLVTLKRDGKDVPGLVQFSKTGNTFVFNRLTGELLSDVEERPVPSSELLGGSAYPTQPFVKSPEPFSRQIVTEDDYTTISEASTAYAKERLQNADLGWFVPPSLKGAMFYGIHGGAEWGGGAFDPENQYAYINSNNLAFYLQVQDFNQLPDAHPGEIVYAKNGCAKCHGTSGTGITGTHVLIGLDKRYSDTDLIKEIVRNGKGDMPAFVDIGEESIDAVVEYLYHRDAIEEKKIKQQISREIPKDAKPDYGISRFEMFIGPEGYPANKPPWGEMNAIDLRTGKIAWKVPLGEFDELTERGIPQTGAENFGGPLVTKGGLVFIAATKDECIRAFDKETGEELWKYKLPFGGYTTPSTYEVDGKQYLVIPCGGGGKPGTMPGDAFVSFALP